MGRFTFGSRMEHGGTHGRQDKVQAKESVYPLCPNVGMHILHTVLYTFPKVLTIRICPTFKRFFSCLSHPITFVTLMSNLAMIL